MPYQLWEYHRKLRMSKEDVRQEMKEQEGDPQIKARIRAAQREMSRRRMMTQVPTADVVVTNPTHYAVALKYDPDKAGAPIVVAKGMNLMRIAFRWERLQPTLMGELVEPRRAFIETNALTARNIDA